MQLSGARVLVTGGASGLGRATAEHCAARGASVAINNLDSSRFSKTDLLGKFRARRSWIARIVSAVAGPNRTSVKPYARNNCNRCSSESFDQERRPSASTADC